MKNEQDEEPAQRVSIVDPLFLQGELFAQRFQIKKMIGQGGMGSVYVAHDIETNEEVALKIIKKSALKKNAKERFDREVQVLESVNHPCIVGVKAFGYDEKGAPWLAMELLHGENLKERVKRTGPMNVDELIDIMSEACDALTQMHGRGVVHRDLKPDHLFLPESREQHVKILDFGLSLLAGSKRLTKTGMVIGTPRYMAPEQIASAHESDGQADVYSLGVIAYEALTGDSPFAVSHHGQLLGAILQGKTEPLALKRPDILIDVVRVIEIAMAPDLHIRFKTPSEFASVLKMVAQGEKVPQLDRHSDPSALSGRAQRESFFDIQSQKESSLSNLSDNISSTEQLTMRWVKLGIAAFLILAISATVSYYLMK